MRAAYTLILLIALLFPFTSAKFPPSKAISFTEDFESASKTSYSAGNIQLSSGEWYFDDALIGSLSNDHKDGGHAARIRNGGSIRTNFDLNDGASTIIIKHAVFGEDGNSSWELLVSADAGIHYSRIGHVINSSSPTLQTASFQVHLQGKIRIAIIKTEGGDNRINIDDVEIQPFSEGNINSNNATKPAPPTNSPVSHPGIDDDNMLLGNPSHATADINNFDNYLMVKADYTVSYNRDQGKPNWVSWHLQGSDLNVTDRSNDFRPDETLPGNWYHVTQNSYKNSGFDRGHNCPSADRTANTQSNSSTFLMTNMMPQAPRNNQQTWKNLEGYERELVQEGNELYIIAGSYGRGGIGKNGPRSTIDDGHITVPADTWKVIVVLHNGNNDISRINTDTRVIAVIMPNINTINTDWKKYQTSVKAIELATGYDLLSNVSPMIQQAIETKVDNQ